METIDTIKIVEQAIDEQLDIPIREGIAEDKETLDVSSVVEEPQQDHAKVRSKLWDNFSRFVKDGERMAKCRHCGNVLKANSRNDTTTLRNHIRLYCKKLKKVSSRQDTIDASFAKHVSRTTSSAFDQDISRKGLAQMIILHEYPPSLVDHVGFRRFVSYLQPSFKCPSRNTIKKDILEIYMNEKLKAIKTIDKVEGKVAITSDMWTANNQTKGYMVVTAHFINNSWKLESWILSFTYVPTPHTSEALTDVMMKTLLDWNIDRKLSIITLDNCSTNDAMVDNLLGRLDERHLLLGDKLLHVRCCAHVLNIIVQDGLEEIKGAISTIRFSMVYWSTTPKRVEMFGSTCVREAIPFSKNLFGDCKTRWNSTYLMLQTALLYKDIFSRLKQRDKNYNSIPTNEEWKLAEAIVEKLKVFYDVTKLFSATSYPTSNMFFDKICEIKLRLNDWIVHEPLVIKDMAISMALKFEKYWDVVHGNMSVAVILDPQFKTYMLEFYYIQLYKEYSMRHIQKIKQLLYKLIGEYQAEKKASVLSVGGSFIEDSNIPKNMLTACDAFVSSRKKSRISSTCTELDFYWEEDVLLRCADFDILLWWKISGVKYPMLQHIAKDIFAISMSTVASESAFSAGGRLISPHRSKLKEELVEALMCSQKWLWAVEKGGGRIQVDDYITVNDEKEEDDVAANEMSSVAE